MSQKKVTISFCCILLLLSNISQAISSESCGTPSVAQEVSKASKTKADKIISEFGSNGLVNFEQMKFHHAVMIASSIDANKNGSLEYSEYIESLMYCSKKNNAWECEIKPTSDHGVLAKIEDPESKTLEQKHKSLGGNLLVNQEGHWAAPIELRSRVMWQAAGIPENQSLNSDQLAASINSIGGVFSLVKKTKWLESEIRAGASSQIGDANQAVADSVDRALKKKILCSADNNQTHQFSYAQFNNLFGHPKALGEYLELVNLTDDEFGMTVSLEELLNPLLYKHAPITGELFNQRISSDFKNIIDDAGPANIVRIADILNDMELASIKAKKNRALISEFGVPWIKNKGLVVAGGDPKYNPRKKQFALDLDRPYTTLQFIKDFTNAGSASKPAKLSWTKPKGESSITSIDAALRLNFYRPSWADLSEISFIPSLGVDYSRSGINDDKEEQIEYYLLGDFTFNRGWGFTKAHGLEIGPVYQEDKVKRVETLTGLIQWKPILELGNYVTGTEYPVTDNIGFFFQPKFAYELNDIRKQPIDSELVDADFLVYNFVSRLTFGERLSLGYEYTDRKEQDGLGRSFDFQQWELSWKLDQAKFYSLTLEYEKGSNPPLFKEIDRYTLGLGVRF